MPPPDVPSAVADGTTTSSTGTTSGQSADGAVLLPGTAAAAAAAAAAARLIPSAGPDGASAAAGATSSAGGGRPKAQRGPRPRLFRKHACQADGCPADLSGCAFYLQRNHICPEHLKSDSYNVRGVPSRFCQRCGQGHPLTEFDGCKRSCRKALQKHNERRRVKPNSTGSNGTAGAAEAAGGSAAAHATAPAGLPAMLPIHLGAPSLVTSAAAGLPNKLPAPLPLQLGAQAHLLGGGRCAAAAGGPLPAEVAHARVQMEALRLAQQPNQWVLLPQSLLERHVPQLLAAALTVGGLAGPQQAATLPLQLPPQQQQQALLVHAPLPVPRIRAPGAGSQFYSLLQGEFDGSGI